jgi:IclR family transcriptional regulator, acetate operon repressor
MIGHTTEPNTKRSDNVQALSRALGILKYLAETEDGAKLTEIARAVQLAPSTTHRLLTTLQRDRFVMFDVENAHWYVGVQSFVVGNAFRHGREDLVRLARPFLRRLVEQTGETANLAIEDDGMVVYLAQMESRQTVRAIAKTGGRAYMHSSALGKVLLAGRDSTDIERVFEARGLPQFTDYSIHSLQSLLPALSLVRRQGFGVDDQEYALGLRCVGAAIYNHEGQAVAAVSISGPTVRVTQERVAELGATLRRVAQTMSAELGGKVPDL